MLLRRAGLIDDTAYLKLLTKTLNQVQQAPGRQVQSVAQASFDAWVKFYRQDENTANATVSYYTKGALVALCLDLAIAPRRPDHAGCRHARLVAALPRWPMTRSRPARRCCRSCSGRSWQAELQAWVHSTAELPVAESAGCAGHHDCKPTQPQPAQRLGLRVTENGAIRIKTVCAGPAPSAPAWPQAMNGWASMCKAKAGALGKLADLALYAGNASHVTALIAGATGCCACRWR